MQISITYKLMSISSYFKRNWIITFGHFDKQHANFHCSFILIMRKWNYWFPHIVAAGRLAASPIALKGYSERWFIHDIMNAYCMLDNNISYYGRIWFDLHSSFSRSKSERRVNNADSQRFRWGKSFFGDKMPASTMFHLLRLNVLFCVFL